MANHGRSSDDDPSDPPAGDQYPQGRYPRDQYPAAVTARARRRRWPGQAEREPAGPPGPPRQAPVPAPGKRPSPAPRRRPPAARPGRPSAGPHRRRCPRNGPTRPRAAAGPVLVVARTAAQPALPRERADPRTARLHRLEGRGEPRAPGRQAAGQCRPSRRPGSRPLPGRPGAPVRATAANPMLDPARTTAPSARPSRTTGAMPADRRHADDRRATGGRRQHGGRPSGRDGAAPGDRRAAHAGATRTAKPIAPGTGKARIILPSRGALRSSRSASSASYLWWRDTVFQHGPGALLIDIGEVLGLLGGYGVVVLVALMAQAAAAGEGASAPTGWPAGTPPAAGTSSARSPGTSCSSSGAYAAAARASVTSETAMTLERPSPTS